MRRASFNAQSGAFRTTIQRFSTLNKRWLDELNLGVPETVEELDAIDLYRTDFENAVKEQEALWLRDGGPTDEEWEEYKTYLSKKVRHG